MIKYPIVMDRRMFCTGQCQKPTDHEVKVYPDLEYQRCKVCGHKQTVRYDREIPVMYRAVDQEELEGILSDLQVLASQVGTRNWGNIGKKDTQFLERVVLNINAVARRVRKLKDRED